MCMDMCTWRLGDVDGDAENEIVCAYENKVMVLNWDGQNNVFVPIKIQRPSPLMDTPFGVVCKDCDNDGNAEILLSYYNLGLRSLNGMELDTQHNLISRGRMEIQ